MRKAARPKFAIAAVFTATAVPVLLPAMRIAGAPDLVQGLMIGTLLGLAILLIVLSLRSRHASDGR